jgi:hypothetical protein
LPGGGPQAAELITCSTIGAAGCDWFTTPTKP